MVDTIKGKYRIVREIARSNDIVYEATDVTLGRRIAIKELNLIPGLTGQARRDRVERFNREARAAGRLDHPNIVSVFDFGEENGRYFIAMEYLEGQSLRDAMQVRGAYPLREALEVLCQILDALAYAHSKNVVHRDIKPDNIHVLPGGQVKLTDFGIARLSDELALTADGQIFGTPSYMSPEQIEGRGLDHRSDLFSLGVVLYEMLAGRKPFVGDGVVAITYAIMNAEPPPLIGVPAGIEQIVRNVLAKNPNQRPASADQMKRDLRAAEQTPALFLPRQPTNMGQTGMGGGYYGGGGGFPSQQPSALPPSGGYGGSYGAAPSMPGYAPVQAQAPAAPAGNLPWGWNGAPPAGGATQYPQTQASYAGQGGVAYPANVPPQYAVPGYPARPPAPAFTMSPGMRQFLIALGVAALLGGLIAGGVLLFIRSYGNYTETAKVQQADTLMTQGQTAYNAQDYATAAKDYEQALSANPTPEKRGLLNTNLAYTYVQLGRAARDSGKLAEARDDFAKALQYQPDYQTAHTELANVKQSLGDKTGAQEERKAVEGVPIGVEPPPKLDNRAPIGSATNPRVDPTPAQDPNQFLNQRRQEAQRLIQDGDTLYQRGDKEGARAKWQDAIEKGAGFPEFDTANQRLHDTEPQVDFGGGG
ncbi:MAG: Serine/threonine protein kinase [Chthonomonadaceae bacterium]|nr:Serine/threonine protein kinase [Chthonomonadaceae bacterium]